MVVRGACPTGVSRTAGGRTGGSRATSGSCEESMKSLLRVWQSLPLRLYHETLNDKQLSTCMSVIILQ